MLAAALVTDNAAAIPIELDLAATSKTPHVFAPKLGVVAAAVIADAASAEPEDTVLPAVSADSASTREPTVHEQLAQRYIAGGYISLCFFAVLAVFLVSSVV